MGVVTYVGMGSNRTKASCGKDRVRGRAVDTQQNWDPHLVCSNAGSIQGGCDRITLSNAGRTGATVFAALAPTRLLQHVSPKCVALFRTKALHGCCLLLGYDDLEQCGSFRNASAVRFEGMLIGLEYKKGSDRKERL